MIPVEDVLFFISDEKYTRVQTPQVEALIRKPIKELVDELDPERFWQIHRSTLVAVNAIAASRAISAAARSWPSRATTRSSRSAAATRTCSKGM
jgi:DNA-binding LytR/AlgR family response regulator